MNPILRRAPASCLSLALLLGLAAGCNEDAAPTETAPMDDATAQASYLQPSEAFGQLFTDVQLAGIFPDSKTFVDMTPRAPAAEILADYERLRGEDGFDLRAFVAERFDEPKMYATGFTSDPDFDLDQHIERLWPVLTREEENQSGGSLIPLPYDYVVPGGRFREVYYWDSYFTMLGLLVDGQHAYARHMVDNFAFLIDEVGFVPNGNRAYYLSRSQPPFFAAMVSLLAEDAGSDSLVLDYLPQLEREYAFWMRGADGLDSVGDRALRVARMPGDFKVNRYFDEEPRPRPEGYREDSLLARESQRAPAELYEDLRAACESGWDFSSRWLTDPDDLGTIRTADLAPVDLNALLYHLETLLASAYALRGDAEGEQRLARAAYERRRAVLTRFWDEELRWFGDVDLATGRTTGEATLAGMFPLFFGLATEAQADAVAERLEADFLRDGGLVTSLRTSGQQWDAPNGWPPLQWVSIAGLRRYGHEALAREVARRWLESGRKVYRRTGKVVEKYNVVDTSLLAGGGEYPNQDGFGWSNGVFARIIEDYPGL